MTTDPTPQEIRSASFRVGFRGYDTTEVDVFLERISRAMEELAEQRGRLASRLGEYADRDLQSEFENVGREVAAVLESARSAAEAMRDRAAADTARWRSEAVAEVETLRREARADTEAMRSDAWAAGTQLLEQVQAEVERQVAGAQRDSLAVLGEAEREAHRLISSGRREADELVRNARMEAEKLGADARADHDGIIANAHRQAESAQERTRALEQRRQELMTELESVREALSSFEGELEDRRLGLGLSEAPDLPRQVVIADERGGRPHLETWEEGHTVRIIRPQRPESAVDESDITSQADPDELAAEVTRLRQAAESEDDPSDVGTGHETSAGDHDAESGRNDLTLGDEPAGVATPESPEIDPSVEPSDEAGEPVHQPPGPPVESPVETPVEPPEEEPSDDVFDLFRRLSQPGSDAGRSELSETRTAQVQGDGPAQPPAKMAPDSASVPEDPNSDRSENGTSMPQPTDGDPFETRDRLLLPITNAALRAVKRVLTDAQNEALDQLRLTEGRWSPDPAALGSGFRADLESLVADAVEAGREAATEMGIGGGPGGEPAVPDVESVASELARALATALDSAGDGTRERSAAASRVFRGWRADEAERRVRWVAQTSYHGALRSAFDANHRPWGWVASGRQCPTCRAAAATAESVPPAHRDCTCTIVAV